MEEDQKCQNLICTTICDEFIFCKPGREIQNSYFSGYQSLNSVSINNAS